MGERVQGFEFGVIKDSKRQRLQWKKLSMWWMDFRKDQMLEGQRNNIGTSQPSITDCSDVILRRQWILQRDCHDQFLWLFRDHMFFAYLEYSKSIKNIFHSEKMLKHT